MATSPPPTSRQGTLKIVTGDFNTGRCLGATTIALCKFTPTWKAMHDAGYRSAVHLLTDDGAFDHIYTTAGIHRAQLDGKYNGKTAGPNEFYSDHQLRWALLSSDVTPPSAPTNVELSSSDPSSVRVTWDPSTNVGTGVGQVSDLAARRGRDRIQPQEDDRSNGLDGPDDIRPSHVLLLRGGDRLRALDEPIRHKTDRSLGSVRQASCQVARAEGTVRPRPGNQPPTCENETLRP